MKFSTVAATAALATVAAARPGSNWEDFPGCEQKCEFTKEIATGIVDGFGKLLYDYSDELATNILSASKFTDTSSSINWLAGAPLNNVTFPSRDSFIAGQGTQPPLGYELLEIETFSCNDDGQGVVAFRWFTTLPEHKTAGSKGINVLRAGKRQEGDGEGVDGWVIETVFSEFNNAVWAIEFGGSCDPGSNAAIPNKRAAFRI